MRRIPLFGACTQRSIADSRLAQVIVILSPENGSTFTLDGHGAAACAAHHGHRQSSI
jgi:hypothetical protein